MIIQKQLQQLFEKWATEDVKSVAKLPSSGSPRQYYRITGETKTVIGAYNAEEKENYAFITFSRHFKRFNLNVPEIYTYDIHKHIYIQEDLGYMTLYKLLSTIRTDNNFPIEAVMLYKRALEQLPKFQVLAGTYFDYSVCYPRSSFDRQSMMWDLNYFKYYFLKLAGVLFDEQKLEDDFFTLTEFLLQAESNYFMYRDFQSRNIMINRNDVFFIDYQGGRKGPLQYDVASLLFDAKADIPFDVREELLEHYLKSVQTHTKIIKENFNKYYYGFALIRIFQAMGAYGYRGYYEKKEHFLTSIPYAVNNLKWIYENKFPRIDIPELKNIIAQIINSPVLNNYIWKEKEGGKLKVRVFSFSYFDKMPEDLSGNGGGFIFDCRAMHNPGRYEQFKDLNGTDREVKMLLDNDPNVQVFLEHAFAIIDEAILNYMSREFTDLMVSFGCTGGQHRSVYAAEKLVNHLRGKYKIIIDLNHTKMKIVKKFDSDELI